jgi:hypothetical protein
MFLITANIMKRPEYCVSQDMRITEQAYKSTGRFIMFSVITNIYYQKTKGLTLKEFFTVHFFNLPVAVKNPIKVGPLVFLLQMFVITATIMKRPEYCVSQTDILQPLFFIRSLRKLSQTWKEEHK